MTINGKTYYFDSLGYRKSGWQKLGKNYYYFSRQTGAMNKDAGLVTKLTEKRIIWTRTARAQTGWLKVGADTYYLNADGAKAFGWLKLNGRKYFLKLKTGKLAERLAEIPGQDLLFCTAGRTDAHGLADVRHEKILHRQKMATAQPAGHRLAENGITLIKKTA